MYTLDLTTKKPYSNTLFALKNESGKQVAWASKKAIISKTAKIHGGEIWGGEILGGEIFNGEIHGGKILGGQIVGGKIFGGKILGGEILEGVIFDGEIHGGKIFGAVTIKKGANVSSTKDYLVLGPLGDDRFITATKSNKKISAGSFYGTLPEFIQACNKKYDDGKSDYSFFFEALEKYFNN